MALASHVRGGRPACADSTRSVTALRVDRPPRIDGDLSEPAWREAEAAGDFFRAQQTRGTPARLRTEAHVLYDTAAIYVGFRCWEPDMAGLRETLTRRDTRVWDDDAVEVVFDTFHDRRNAYIFGINTLGTQMDQRVSNESSFTFAWDASWEAMVRKSDPTLINVNDDRELSLPERRPFFRDGAELFDLPLRLFYTRRVQEIDLGVKGTGKTGGYTWAAVNAYGRIIDRYDGDAKRRANLLNLRLNRDVGERTVIGAMAVHKHQADRDYGLLSLNGRLGLGRDWTAAGQFAGSSTGGGPGYAYHASTNWRNQSRLSGFVELEEIGDRFRPNETGLEDEAYRRARGAITFRNEYSEGSRLNALVMRGRVFRQTEPGGRLREQYAQAEGSLDVGRFDFYSLARSGQLREAGRLWKTRLAGAGIEYGSTKGSAGLYNQVGSRQNAFNWLISLDADANLFSRLTIGLRGQRFYWSARRETLLLRTTTNYQFTRKVGLRLFHERVIERTSDTTEDNFNTVFDYEFTPESHFFLVFVRDRDRSRAVFSKIAYLFGRV